MSHPSDFPFRREVVGYSHVLRSAKGNPVMRAGLVTPARIRATVLKGERGRMPNGMFRRTAVVWAAVLVSVPLAIAGPDVYVQTVIDPSGQLHITTRHRKEIAPEKQKDQVRFDDPLISPDGRAVGWLALYPNSNTSYPIALKLVVLFEGNQREYTGNGLAMSVWGFWAGGKQVAFEQETLHGGASAHYELHDVETGELADKYDPDANPDSVTKPPRWVVSLGSRE